MPKPHIELIARALLIQHGRILLCRSIAGDYYYLPGGHVDFGEPAAAALERELMEEGGISARASGCLLVHESTFETRGRKQHELNVVFHVELESPAADAIKSLEPEIELIWLDLAAIVETDLRPVAMKAWLTSSNAAQRCWLSTIER
jgi:8-oxo-dGTP diphosphatase